MMAGGMIISFHFYDDNGGAHLAEIILPPTDNELARFYIDAVEKDILAGSFNVYEVITDELAILPQAEGPIGNVGGGYYAPAGDTPLT